MVITQWLLHSGYYTVVITQWLLHSGYYTVAILTSHYKPYKLLLSQLFLISSLTSDSEVSSFHSSQLAGTGGGGNLS